MVFVCQSPTHRRTPTVHWPSSGRTVGLILTRACGASWITITSGSGSGNGTVTYSVAANSSTTSRSGSLTVAGQTVTVSQDAPAVPPTISAVANQMISVNTTCGPLSFTVGQAGTSGSALTVIANSSNPTLVPNSNIVLSGNGTNWSVTVMPATNQTGTATIALTVCGAGLCTTTSFGLTVNPLVTAPTSRPDLLQEHPILRTVRRAVEITCNHIGDLAVLCRLYPPHQLGDLPRPYRIPSASL
jgi:all-beta uncharacterized protein